jgi:septum formation protein
MRIILASASPQRKALLQQIGVEPEIMVIAEELVFTRGGEPEAQAVARGKGEAAAAKVTGEAIILAADTVVILDGDILGKPSSPDMAKEMLRRLNGRKHEVITGVYGKNTVSGSELVRSARTEVWFKNLREEQIAGYTRTGEGWNKAGGYGIQGIGAVLVERIAGSYSNVVGLPLDMVADMLQMMGYNLF